MATDKKAMAFDVDVGTGHQRGNPMDERMRQHLEQEAREHAGHKHSLDEAEKKREHILEERKEKAHSEIEHAKEVAAKVKDQRNYTEMRAGKYDSTGI